MPDPREPLGRLVREAWIRWAREQRDPKASWLVPWEDLGEDQREADMRIGAALGGHFAGRRPEPDTAGRCLNCGRTQSGEDWDLAAHARMLQFERDTARLEAARLRDVIAASVRAGQDIFWAAQGIIDGARRKLEEHRG